jgi:hypothetical protein
MKTGIRHWPLVLALLLGLAALFFYRSRNIAEIPTVPPPIPGCGRPGTPPPAMDVGQEHPGSSPPAAPDKPEGIATGSLRVAITGTGHRFAGYLVVLDEDDCTEEQQTASGDAPAEFVIPKLKPGAKRLFFIPDYAFLVDSMEVAVDPARESRATLSLKESAEVRGVVLDSLQQPLPGVRVEITIPGVFVPRTRKTSDNSVWSIFGGRSGGPRGHSVITYHSMSLEWDGSLRRSITTDRDGEFSISGVTGSALTADLSYKEVRFSQVCKTDADNLLIAPVVREAPVRDLEAEERSRATNELLRQMVLHPEAPEPYAAQLRELLLRNLEKSKATPAEREEIRKRIDTIGRPLPPPDKR